MGITRNDFTVETLIDEVAENPRLMDTISTMAMYATSRFLPELVNNDHMITMKGDKPVPADVEKALDAALIMPMYYSGYYGETKLSIDYPEPIERNMDYLIGWIYISKENKELCGDTPPTKDKMMEWMAIEIDMYNSYINGEVYGYRTTNKFGETVGECYGFYGSSAKNDAIESAYDEIDNMIEYSKTQPLSNEIANKELFALTKHLDETALTIVQKIVYLRRLYGEQEVDCMYEYSESYKSMEASLQAIARAIDDIMDRSDKKNTLQKEVRKALGYTYP